MYKVTVGGCRIPVTRNIADNIVEIKKAIDWAADNQVEIMCTPECALSGYMWAPENNSDPRIKEIENGIVELAVYSKDKNVDLVLGTACYNETDKWANTQKFIVNGDIVETTYKRAIFGEELKLYAPGTSTKVFEYNGFKTAGLICNDYWSNPIIFADASGEILRDLEAKGCNLIFLSVNVPKFTGPENIFYRWHDACVSMHSCYGFWNTVVCDNSHTIEGHEYDGDEYPCPSGICRHNAVWERATKPVDYFKTTIRYKPDGIAGPSYY